MDIICGSWWCNNHITKGIRKIDGIIVCPTCYAYVWEKSKKMNLPLEVAFRKVGPPKKTPVHRTTRCFRLGCETILSPEMGSDKYRFIGSKIPVCRNCYIAVWEFKEKHGISTMEEAFKMIPPKGWKPPPKRLETVKCCMPWCENTQTKNKNSLLEGELHVCGKCRSYLNILSRRLKPVHDWKWYALNAMQGKIPAPNT